MIVENLLDGKLSDIKDSNALQNALHYTIMEFSLHQTQGKAINSLTGEEETLFINKTLTMDELKKTNYANTCDSYKELSEMQKENYFSIIDKLIFVGADPMQININSDGAIRKGSTNIPVAEEIQSKLKEHGVKFNKPEENIDKDFMPYNDIDNYSKDYLKNLNNNFDIVSDDESESSANVAEKINDTQQ